MRAWLFDLAWWLKMGRPCTFALWRWFMAEEFGPHRPLSMTLRLDKEQE